MPIYSAKAAILYGGENLQINERRYFFPKKEDLLIHLRYVGICGSDIKLYKGTYSGPHHYPLIIGHEWMGEVVAVGGNVRRFIIGDRVTGDCTVYCNNCQACLSNKNLCSHIHKKGITVDGFLREYAIVNEKYLYKVPEELPDDLVALTEPLAVVIEGISKVSLQKSKNKNVLILGAGTIGLMSLIAMADSGASKVTIVEKDAFRAEKAKQIGATKVINEDVGKYIGSLKDYFSVVIEAIGSYKALELAIHSVRPGGVILCFGHIAKGKINPAPIVEKAITIIGSIGGTGSFEQAFSLMSRYKDKVRNLITNIITLEELPHRFPLLFNGDGKKIKVLVQI